VCIGTLLPKRGKCKVCYCAGYGYLAGKRRYAYTVSTLLPEITQLVESMLYKSMRGLEETKLLLLSLGRHYHRTKQLPVAKLFFQKAEHCH
jgi:hypothetical protein